MFKLYQLLWSGLLLLLITLILSKGQSFSVGAIDPVQDLQKQIEDLEHLKQLSIDATKPLESELKNLDTKIKNARDGITSAKKQAETLAKNIDKRELDLAAQYELLTHRVAQQYKRSRFSSPLLILFSNTDATRLTQDLAYRESVEAQDKRFVAQISQEIEQLEKDKAKLEQDQIKLAALEKQLDGQAEFFRKEISGAKAYQQELSGKIAALSAQQQAILSEKSGTFQTTVGDVPLADDPASRPDYSPGFSPAFAAFSFGAPHFKGLSQYGAYGRAKNGQSAEDILRAYYGSGIEIKKDYSTSININVKGYGSVDIETYVKRIYEMPGSWGENGGMEALKAQAVAARSYALAVTNNGSGSICATEACQVYKPTNKGGKWEEAVNSTRGWVLQAGGKPFSAKYASTSGGYQESYSYNGYSTPGFWDTKRGREGWTAEAYEKLAGSPWFYKGWYRSRGGDSCGRSHPWLNGEEMADILNAWVVLVKNSQSDSRVTPLGSCWSGNPYSINELRDKANSLGGGYSKVTGVSVSYSNSGTTANVSFQTDRGDITVDGNQFYKAFNLRAPGKISIKSGLFNIEKK
jgi:peptidoglycan hydrolase-like amidase